MSQDYQNPYELLQNKSKINERNFDKSPQTKLIKDSPDFENKKNKIFELGLISAQDDAQDYEKICETKYENLKFAQKIKRLLTPFSFFYSQKWVENSKLILL